MIIVEILTRKKKDQDEEQKGKSIEGLKKRARRKVARARAATQGAQGGYYQTV